MKSSDQTYHYDSTANAADSNARTRLLAGTTPSLKITRRRLANLRQRRQLRKLLRYDDHLLTDIGYNRGDILRTLRLSSNRQTVGTFDHLHSLQSMLPKSSRVQH